MIVLHVIAGHQAAGALADIKMIATHHPGDETLTLAIRTPEQLLRGEKGRRLTLGREWRYDGSAACVAALRRFGDVAVTDGRG